MKTKDRDCDDETVVKITHVADRCSIQLLQQYFFEKDFSDAHHADLDMYTNEVFKKVVWKGGRLFCTGLYYSYYLHYLIVTTSAWYWVGHIMSNYPY